MGLEFVVWNGLEWRAFDDLRMIDDYINNNEYYGLWGFGSQV